LTNVDDSTTAAISQRLNLFFGAVPLPSEIVHCLATKFAKFASNVVVAPGYEADRYITWLSHQPGKTLLVLGQDMDLVLAPTTVEKGLVDTNRSRSRAFWHADFLADGVDPLVLFLLENCRGSDNVERFSFRVCNGMMD